MEFHIAAVFVRSVTIELSNRDRFEMPDTASVYLRQETDRQETVPQDGEEVPFRSGTRRDASGVNWQLAMRTSRNVITLADLDPDTPYGIRLEVNGQVSEQHFRTRRERVLLNVKRFGAAGDGVSDDTAALQAAICSCPEDGTVYVPEGTYLCSPLFLRSNMTLWLERGAVLLGDPDRRHYPVLPGMTRADSEQDAEEYYLGTWEGNPLDSFASLITGIGVHDVDICGPGTLDGNAAAGDWWKDHRVKRIAWRPNTIFLNYCTNVRVQNLTVRNSPAWTVHPYYSDHLQFLNLNIQNPYDSPNTDGFDPESCTDVTLLGTVISVGDDCIAIKSGKLYMAVKHFRRTEGIEIRNCRFERGHGSVTVGSEIAGGVTDVHVSQCIFRDTDRGLRVKTRRGRGERSLLDGIVFENIRMDGVHMPVTVNMFYFCDPDGHSDYVQSREPLPVDDKTPSIGTIVLRDAECRGISSCFVCAMGLPERPIGEIRLENVRAQFLPEEEQKPDRPVMMDHFTPVAGAGIIAENVHRLQMKNVVIVGSRDTAPRLVNVSEQEMEDLQFG